MDNIWQMDKNHQKKLSREQANTLCSGLPLPRMGFETPVIRCPDGYGGSHTLRVQNISGDFYVACSSLRLDEWPSAVAKQLKCLE